MAIREREIPSEKAFSDLWERALELRPSVIGRDGVAYEVVFPGVRNQGAGPDFLGAALRRNGRAIGGDVELHLDPSGWRAHGHHTDPNYRGVVLQVVLKAGRSGVSHPAPPTAVARFGPLSDELANDSANEPDDAPGSQDASATNLRALGMARFRSKSAGFRLEMESASNPDQPLYAGLLDAMGYARNRKPFRALAALLPVERLGRLADEPRATAEFAILSAFVARGGLLGEVNERERVQMRRVARRLGAGRNLPAEAWSRFRVRPTNAPLARMRGLASLIARNLKRGLLRGFEETFERDGARGLLREVENKPNIGNGLARATVANVILPSLHAAAVGESARRIESAFADMPAPPGDAVTRGVSTALGLDARPKTAAEHSGLHWLARRKSWPGSG